MSRRALAAAMWVAVSIVFAPACTPSEPELLVELKTDLVPSAEFSRVRTVVLRSDGSTGSREQDSPVSAGADYLMGQRVAEFAGLAPGNLTVRVELFGPDGRQFIERSVRVAFQKSSGMTVLITRSCQGVSCEDSARPECLGGRCVSLECTHGNEEACGEPQCVDAGDCDSPAPCAAAICVQNVCLARPLLDGCPGGQYCDAAVGCLDLPSAPDGGMPDGGDAGGCAADAECDDGLDCTADTCASGECTSAPDDSLCTDGSGGACIADFGCQYDGCSPTTCVAGSCETARCDGDTCVIESDCLAGEMCCGDACVSAGCDDGNPCTDDSCGALGCDNTPNSAACDDGVFCNGADTCGDGTCSAHAGDPCGSGTTCDEPASSCVGCIDDADCPADIVAPWSACSGYSGTCDETGTRSRTRTSFSCSSGSCVRDDMPETGACGRSTGGVTCGSTTFSAWGSCGGYGSSCDETGTRSRTRTDRTCSSGTCQDQMSTDTGSCSRDTDGVGCGLTTYGPWGACGGYANTCDETGSRTRTQTDRVCVTGTCQDQVGTDPGSCSRDTDGTTCGSTTYGSWGSCTGYTSTCDETGMRSRSETQRLCSTGTCADSVGTDAEGCSRDTDGNGCSNFPGGCRRGNCAAGSCNLIGSECGAREFCCEPGICICDSCDCP